MSGNEVKRALWEAANELVPLWEANDDEIDLHRWERAVPIIKV